MLAPNSLFAKDSLDASSSLIRVGPLLRATGEQNATIWLELATSCLVALDISPLPVEATRQYTQSCMAPESTSAIATSSAHTVTVGGRYYVSLSIDRLHPATWYSYRIRIQHGDQVIEPPAAQLQCFRTMDASSSTHVASLRLAYGSCRKEVAPETDALSALGRWLLEHWEQRETAWPHLLLLIGDQIYADQPPEALSQAYPQLQGGASSFETFALLYDYMWTADADVRQALAVLPTYLIFDDHEITNNWNQLPQWCASMLANGHEQLIVDGLVAYWVYQGWGNLARQANTQHPLLDIMQEGELHDADIIEHLRDEIRREVRGERSGHWHYEIAVHPAIFVANARSERTSIFDNNQAEILAPTRILSKGQMADFQEWIHEHDDTLAILVSSVPIILPPVIGFAEYIAGVRFLQHGPPPLRWIGQRLARLQQRLAGRLNFDHWPAYSETWREFVHLLSKRRHNLVALSGDVHFSYAIEARASRYARLLQLVSTPLQNELSSGDKQIIVKQALVTSAWYGGLFMRMFSMIHATSNRPIPHAMLFQNALAYVTFKQNRAGQYLVQQDYLAVVNGELQFVGRTKIPTR